MTKNDLIINVAKITGEKNSTAQKVTEAVIESIQNALAQGDTVTLQGFGAFKPVAAPQRQARNPKTGDMVTVPAKTKVKFIPGKNLKEAVNS